MLRKKRGQRIPIRSIVAIIDLQLRFVVDTSALEASIGLFFGHDFGENFEHPAIHDVVCLFSECNEEAAFCAGRYECNDRLRKEPRGAGVETGAIILRPYSQSIIVMQRHQFPSLLHLLDIPHQNRDNGH